MAFRVGIFGGSFNPIHKGHIQIAKQICKSELVDELWLMVSPHNPLKERSELMPDEERLDLAQKAVKDISKVKVSDFEMRLPKPSYMYNTLLSLRESYPDYQFVLIIGSDNWLCFNKWYKYEEIINQFNIIIYPRKGSEIEIATLPPNVTLLQMPLYDISSTMIRQKLQSGEDVSNLLP